MLLIISVIFSFKINKPFPWTFFCSNSSFPLIYFSFFKFIAFEIILLTYPGKLSVVKGIATFASAFLPKLPNKELKDSSG